MSRVYWDTPLFIYLFEDVGNLSKRVVEIRHRMLLRHDELYTSTLCLSEVLAKPLEENRQEVAAELRQGLITAAVLLPFDQKAAQCYSIIRQDRSIGVADAVHLACAAAAGIDLFITNDDRLSKKIVPGIQFIAALDAALL
jgi:predicted nucleic acid-binding protein